MKKFAAEKFCGRINCSLFFLHRRFFKKTERNQPHEQFFTFTQARRRRRSERVTLYLQRLKHHGSSLFHSFIHFIASFPLRRRDSTDDWSAFGSPPPLLGWMDGWMDGWRNRGGSGSSRPEAAARRRAKSAWRLAPGACLPAAVALLHPSMDMDVDMDMCAFEWRRFESTNGDRVRSCPTNGRTEWEIQRRGRKKERKRERERKRVKKRSFDMALPSFACFLPYTCLLHVYFVWFYRE